MRQALFLALALVVAPLAALTASADMAHAAPVYKTATNIDTQPAGAEVFLVTPAGDTSLGLTPLKRVKIPRGTTQIRIKKDGYEDQLQTLTIATQVQSFVFTLVRSIKPAQLEFISGLDFAGATIEIDGKVSGVVPNSVTVAPGRHQVVVKKDGYTNWERWVEAAEGQKVSFDIVLNKAEAARGALLVTSSPSGAEVRINGAPKGVTPTVVDGLAPGPYFVEVSLRDFTPYSQNVTVEAGQRAIMDAQLAKARGDTGEIKVLANGEGVQVTLDGDDIGVAPVTRSGIKPGIHSVQGRDAKGNVGEAQAEIRAGEVTVVRLTLATTARPDKAEVRVAASVPGATVSVDGGPDQPIPHLARDLDPGTHVFTVKAAGFAAWTKNVPLQVGLNPEIVAELAQAGRIEVKTKDTAQADVFVNGKPIGRTPFVGDLPVGTHTVLVQRADGAHEEFQIAVASDRIVRITAAFGADAKKPATKHRPMPLSARALSTGTGHISAMVSWPQWAFPLAAEAGGGIGYGMDINVFLRTGFDAINELEVLTKWNFVDSKVLAAAVEVGLGGGLGAEDRSSFFFRLNAKGSLMIGEKAAITAWFGMLYHTDRIGPETNAATRERDAGVRFYLGLNVEFEVAKSVNLMAMLSGDPLVGGRRLLDAGFLDDPDPKLYAGIGASFLF